MPKLVTWMNNQRVGELTKLANGAHTFKYAPEWLASRYARPLSLSLPLQRGNITSDAVYDIISAFPVLGGTGIHISDLKLAMGLNASKGKKTAIDKIYPRHFLATAKVLKFPEVQMHEILSDFARMIPAALDNVKNSLPTDFPENVVTAVETNVLRLHGRLSREYGIK
ncbi:hypothetical protein A8439_002743 [Escherichia coli]|nr:hypothetical protein [Escherichia coli]